MNFWTNYFTLPLFLALQLEKNKEKSAEEICVSATDHTVLIALSLDLFY